MKTHLLKSHLRKIYNASTVQTLVSVITSGISAILASNAAAYDNSRPPPFDMETRGRGYQSISLHPNKEELLISECSSKLAPYRSCFLLLYDLKSGQQKRFMLPNGYRYTYGKFSPSGKYILMVRNPDLVNGSEEKIQKNLQRGEIAVMDSDGNNFRVLTIPAGRLFAPAMSISEGKIAYWAAATPRAPDRQTALTHFDIREFDLEKGTDSLFAGPFYFYSGTSIQYLSESELLVHASIPNANSLESWNKLSKFNRSEIYKISRGMSKAPEPEFQDLPNSTYPAADRENTIFFMSQPHSIGVSLTRKKADGFTTLWRYPSLNYTYQSALTAAGSGRYIGVIYGGSPLKTEEGDRAICVFDLETEQWIPLSPPPLH